MILEIIKVSLQLVKAGVELGTEIAKAVNKGKERREKIRALRTKAINDKKAAKEYTKARAGLKPVEVVPADAAGSGKEVLQGTMVLKTLGVKMTGTFVDGELEGHGVQHTQDTQYEGDFVDGLYHGIGKLHYIASGSTYTGQFVNGVADGTGKMTTKKGSEMSGTFENGVLVSGVIITPKGISFEGSIEGWTPKNGTVTYPSGLVYKGEMKDWMWNGKGVLTYPKRNRQTGKEYKAIFYRGDFVQCKFEGEGEMRWRSGYKFQGQWKDSNMVKESGSIVKFDLNEGGGATPALPAAEKGTVAVQ